MSILRHRAPNLASQGAVRAPPTDVPIRGLYSRGARFVQLDDGFTPQWKRWNTVRPSPRRIYEHFAAGRNIGIVPASIGFSVLDVDHGDPVRLAEAHEPSFFLDSRTPGRAHLGYDVGALSRDGTFEIEGCAGEVKVCGYVSLHGRERALERIHGAVVAMVPKPLRAP